jgi:hypothetical protein
VAPGFPYPAEIELSMKVLYRSLRENDRRRYAACEAAKLGHGGVNYVAALLGCDPTTIREGQQDLDHLAQLPFDDVRPDPRVRRPGGGRKKNGGTSRTEVRLRRGGRATHRRFPGQGPDLAEFLLGKL